jgi:hypothetical protein
LLLTLATKIEKGFVFGPQEFACYCSSLFGTAFELHAARQWASGQVAQARAAYRTT